MGQPLNVVGGLDDAAAYKVPCACATTVDMTNTMIGLPIIDGYQTKSGDRILVWQNTDQTTNGIYQIPPTPNPTVPPPNNTSAWTRSLDFTNTDSVYFGTQVVVTGGNLYGNQIFSVQSPSFPTFGADPIIFVQSPLAVQAATSAAAASASAAAASASAAAAAAAAAGSGGMVTINCLGGTITLTPAQANAAFIVLTGSLTNHQFLLVPPGVTNQPFVINSCAMNGFEILIRANGGLDQIGIFYLRSWGIPLPVLFTPGRVYWGDYGACPPGTYKDIPVGSVIPPSYLPCDGQAGYSTMTYDLLFSIIGYTFGGAGTAFSVPDDRDLAAIGADNMLTPRGPKNGGGGLNGQVPGQAGGEPAHTLTIPEIPSHSHTGVPSAAATTAGLGASAFNPFRVGGAATDPVGGGQAHNNMPPYRNVTRMIRF